MKNILFLLIAFSTVTSAQTFTTKASFGLSETDKQTGQAINVQGKSFEIWQTASGTQFVKAICKNGNVYPVWIGTETEHEFEGEPVRVSKGGTHFILALSPKTGYPYAVYLEKNT